VVAPQRATPADLTALAADRPGGAPAHIGVLLVLDGRGGGDAERVRRALVERVPAVPRLRQRLVVLAPGLGRPVWVDDADFDADRHVRPHPARAGRERALLDAAAEVLTRPLPRSRPLWSATVVAPAGGPIGVVLVLHHVVADGIGGLAVLDRLLDGAPPPPARDFPQPPPRARALLADATRTRLRGLAGIAGLARELRGMRAAGGGTRIRVSPCSLLAPTGNRRRLGVARADLAAVRRTAHRHGGTVNDVLLAAVAGALGRLLARRGERIEEVRVAVIAGAHRTAATQPQNLTAPLVVAVPVEGTPGDRVRRIAGLVRAARTPALDHAPVVVLHPLFRLAARTGLYRLAMRRQRRMHTLVSNVRGPGEPRRLAGAPVRDLVPLSVGEAGDLTVQFVALSYAGTLTVTVVADPDQVPDLAVLTDALQAELAVAAGGAPPPERDP
jgi:diacylglycerol O-acyltransferase / wax synthase